MPDFVMPSLGADMESGTLLEWLVKPGDRVKRGDIVAVVDTSKAEIEVEIFDDGVIDELLVAEGERVPVGTVLATVLPAGVNGGAPAPTLLTVTAPPVSMPLPPAPAPPPPPRAIPPPVAGEHRLRVSPLARRTAEQLGVELASVTGSGRSGAITRADVEAAAQPPSPAAPAPAPAAAPPAAPAPAAAPPPTAAADRQTAMREAIAALMARSKREIPHYYLEARIDMTRALEWMHDQNLRRPINERLLSSVLLLSAVAHAVADTPELNGFWIDGAFQPGTGIHLGVAISLRGGGLIAPALHDADRMSLDELMAGVRDLVARARSGRLKSSEMSDPTITVTNLGERGVDLVHGVIYPPQVALVGFGGIHERPWAAGGMLGVRPIVIATLAADHRASDGHSGSRLLALIDHRLQEPEKL
ncbi:MAG TPA: dihydrolipoamide acetyltransferase family protein [Solirubrobacteraceae bacterium]|nr:dihydrolipoamide acetyltransferase family protein [Solirubrobacteraceae bacterium]